MLHKQSIVDRRYQDKGMIGESFIRWWCGAYNTTYKKATYEENTQSGIDAFIEGIPTDIKNTRGIYFGNFYKDTGKFLARHPFKSNTLAKNYLILDIEDIYSFKISYYGSIAAYLSVYYFNNPDCYYLFKKKIQDLNLKDYKTLNYNSLDNFIYEVKLSILPFLRPNVICNYKSTSTDSKDIAIKLITQEDNDKEMKYIKEKGWE